MVGFESPGDTYGMGIQGKWAALENLSPEEKEERQEKLCAAGRSIARDLGEVNRADSLLLLFGDMHIDSNAKVMAGAQEVLGEDFPIVGGASPPEYACYVAGELKPAQVMGILLTMPMRVAALLAQVPGKEMETMSPEQCVEAGVGPFKRVLAEISGAPEVIFMFDCQSRWKLRNHYLPSVLEQIPPRASLLGFAGSGENGPPATGDKSVGTGGALVLCAIKHEDGKR
jgi:hypothetical protein